MSDFEINKAVAEYWGFVIEDDEDPVDGCAVSVSVLDGGYASAPPFNPCNNPSDAWSIIAENKIDIELPHEEVNQIGFASNHFEGVVHEIMPNDNPLRAACIVYLMMQEGKQCLASQ